MLYCYHARIKKQEEYVDCRLQYGIVYHDCFAGSDGSDWALNDSKYTLCYDVTQFGDRMFKEGPRFNLLFRVPLFR